MMAGNNSTNLDNATESWAENIDDELGQAANQEEHQTGVLQTIRNQPKLVGWCFYAILCCLLISFENQAASMVLTVPEFRKDFGYLYEGSYVLETAWQSAFYGAPIGSAIIGSLAGASIADKFGRRPFLAACITISFAAIAIEFVAVTNATFFGGKLLNGFATAAVLSCAMAYLGEIVPLAVRGLFTCMSALMMTLGPLISAIIVDKTGELETRWAYRSVFCAQFGFAALVFFPVWFMPESPSWLVSIGKEEQAAISLRRLGYSEIRAAAKLANIRSTLALAQQQTEGATYMECFKRSNLRRTIISIMPLVIQALGGVYFIAAYGTYYIQLAGYSTDASFKLQIAQQGLSMFGNICSWFLVDRVGRRSLTLWGTVILTAILMICGGLAADGRPSYIKGSVAMIVMYNWFYNVTLGATAYTLLTEVATSKLRVKTISIGIAAQYSIYLVLAFVLPLIFNPNAANLGAKTSFIFGGFSILSVVYLWFYQVETAGRSYEELDEMFQKGVPVRDFKTYVTDIQKRQQELAPGKLDM
ncbi:general substrate transporter [Xylariales sp. PMI_506]|nr:general substrate transporter [Xylariales sp. PMI_506]